MSIKPGLKEKRKELLEVELERIKSLLPGLGVEKHIVWICGEGDGAKIK